MKTFKEMYALDITKYVEKKPTFKREGGKLTKLPEKYWLDYIEWATVITLLYDNGAEKVAFGLVENNEGYPAFYHNGKNPFIKIWLQIDENRYEYEYPVIDGNRVEENPDQFKIHKAQQRAFVKAVAIYTGLGLKLWQKEEQIFDAEGEPEKKTERKKMPFPMDKFPEAVKWLKDGKTIDEMREYWVIDEDTDTKLMDAAI